MKAVGNLYLGSHTQCKCHLIQGRPTFTNYAQPQHCGGNARKIKNCRVLMAGNWSSADGW